MALGPAAEAIVVPQNFVVAASTPWPAAAMDLRPIIADAPFVGPAPYLGPSVGAPPAARDTVPAGAFSTDAFSASPTGIQLLQQLITLTPEQLAEFVDTRPDAISSLLANPPAAREVTAWWGALSPQLQDDLLAASPELVGNLEGVPFAIRDGANREFLDETMQSLHTLVGSEAGRTVIDHAEQQLRMLEAIAVSLHAEGGPQRTLLSLDVAGQGRAAIVLGNLRTADYVTYLVPGMFFTIENQMGDWTTTAAELYSEEVEWLQRFADAEPTPTAPDSVATVAWIGYHTPNLTNVGALDNAIEGRDALTAAIEGLQALRGADEPYISVVAHSYGSTAALMALTDESFEIDALAMIGSPGSDAQSVDALHVRGANVWVGEAAWDPVPNSAFFGSDPGSPEYGANKLGVDGGTDPITGEPLSASIGHIAYFVPGSQAMRNLALVSIDRGEFVSDGSAADASKTLDLLD